MGDLQTVFYIVAIFFMLFVVSMLGFVAAFLLKFRRNMKKIRSDIETKGVREAIGDKNLSMLAGAGVLTLIYKVLRLKNKK